jgi:hypothetical protein
MTMEEVPSISFFDAPFPPGISTWCEKPREQRKAWLSFWIILWQASNGTYAHARSRPARWTGQHEISVAFWVVNLAPDVHEGKLYDAHKAFMNAASCRSLGES